MKIQLIAIALQLLSSVDRSAGDPGDIGQCEIECFCIPDDQGFLDPSSDNCPSLGNRFFPAATGDALVEESTFFQSLMPIEGTLPVLDPPGCTPFPTVAGRLGLPTCTGFSYGGGDRRKLSSRSMNRKLSKSSKSSSSEEEEGLQCAFKYRGNVCENQEYSLVERPLSAKTPQHVKTGKNSKGKYITHEGNCGVCSNAFDLGVALNSNYESSIGSCFINTWGGALSTIVTSSDPIPPSVFASLTGCFQNIGHSQECASVWAGYALEIALLPFLNPSSAPSCAQLGGALQGLFGCLANNNNDPLTCIATFVPNYVDGTCDNAPATACPEDTGARDLFVTFAGRDYPNSGFLEARRRFPCSKYADIDQPYPDCPAD